MSKRTEITGYTPDELINNKDLSFFSLMHEDDNAEVEKEIRKCIAAKKPWSVEYRMEEISDGSIPLDDMRKVELFMMPWAMFYILDGFISRYNRAL